MLFLINSLRGGGAEKVLVNLVNCLDANKYDITVGVLFGDGVNKQFLHQNIKVKRFFKKAPKGFVYLAKLFSPSFLHRLFIKERYDVEISFLQGVCTRIIGGAPEKIPIVTWIHNFDRPDRIFRSQDEKKNILSRQWLTMTEKKKLIAEIQPFYANIPAFKRLAIILEKEKDYESAIRICDQAIAFYSAGHIQSQVMEFEARKQKLLKKSN